MPEPTNTPSTPICIIKAASAGDATPPAAKFTTGSLQRPNRCQQQQQQLIQLPVSVGSRKRLVADTDMTCLLMFASAMLSRKQKWLLADTDMLCLLMLACIM